MRKIILVLIILTILPNAFSYPLTPNPDLSPGEYCTIEDPDFDRFRYEEKIAYCRRNVHPRIKDEVCLRDGVEERKPRYTVDHIIPLSLGGSNSRKNLWCQHRDIYSAPMEYHYYTLVRDGLMSRFDAVTTLLRCKFFRECGEWQITTKESNNE